MMNVPIIINRMDSVSAALRPPLSAYAPNTIAPSGRMKNDTPNVPSVSRMDTESLSEGKNSFEITTAKGESNRSLRHLKIWRC